MRSPKTGSTPEPLSWPGHYLCEQCLPAPVGAAQTCWNYDIIVPKDDALGSLRLIGPEGAIGMKVKFDDSATPETVEVHYAGPLDNWGTAQGHQPDEILVLLQHRDEDTLLRFRGLPSKVDNQTVITCNKNHN